VVGAFLTRGITYAFGAQTPGEKFFSADFGRSLAIDAAAGLISGAFGGIANGLKGVGTGIKIARTAINIGGSIAANAFSEGLSAKYLDSRAGNRGFDWRQPLISGATAAAGSFSAMGISTAKVGGAMLSNVLENLASSATSFAIRTPLGDRPGAQAHGGNFTQRGVWLQYAQTAATAILNGIAIGGLQFHRDKVQEAERQQRQASAGATPESAPGTEALPAQENVAEQTPPARLQLQLDPQFMPYAVPEDLQLRPATAMAADAPATDTAAATDDPYEMQSGQGYSHAVDDMLDVTGARERAAAIMYVAERNGHDYTEHVLQEGEQLQRVTQEEWNNVTAEQRAELFERYRSQHGQRQTNINRRLIDPQMERFERGEIAAAELSPLVTARRASEISIIENKRQAANTPRQPMWELMAEGLAIEQQAQRQQATEEGLLLCNINGIQGCDTWAASYGEASQPERELMRRGLNMAVEARVAEEFSRRPIGEQMSLMWDDVRQGTSDYVQNSRRQLQSSWDNGSTSDRVEIAATGVGTAGGVIPYFGDYVALAGSLVVLGAKPSWQHLGDLGLDAAGALLPFMPAAGSLRRLDRLGEVADLAHDSGRISETADTLHDAEQLAGAPALHIPERGEVGHVTSMRQQPRAEYDANGVRTSENEHIIPGAQLREVTRNPVTGVPDYTPSRYRNDATVRAERDFALDKTHRGPTADNVRTADIQTAAADGRAVSVSENLLLPSLANAQRARTATGSVLTDAAMNRAALGQMSNLFSLQRLEDSGRIVSTLPLSDLP
jgi:hypothetical protein